jgi:hypothetical protein
MNRQETKEKLIKFCEGLNAEGLLSNEELKECRVSFDAVDTSISKIGNIPKINDNLSNYGMSKDQAMSADKLILGSNKNTLARIVIYKNKRDKDGISKKTKMTLYSTIESDTSAKLLYIKELEGIEDSNNDNFDDKIANNITFRLTKNDKGQYTIRNVFSNELLKVQMDKKILLDGTNETPNALFNIKNVGRYIKFESTAFPGYYINASNPLKVVEGSIPTQNWQLELIDDNDDTLEGGSDNNNEYSAEHTRQLVNNYMKKYESSRIDYLLNSATIKYIEILQKRIKSMVAKKGILIEYLRDRVANGEIKLSKEDLMIIEANIYEEVVNNEIQQLEMKKELIGDKQFNDKSNTSSNYNAIIDVYKLLDEAIENKKVELDTLNKLMDKVNVESKKLNMDDKEISSVLEVKEDIHERSSHNNKIIELQHKQEIMNFRLFIGVFVVSLIFGAYSGFKLFNRIKAEM